MVKFLFYILLSSFIFSKPVNYLSAVKVANNVNKEYNSSPSKSNYVIDSYDEIFVNNTKVIYAFHLVPNGFVLISASDKVNPIVGYSFNSELILNNDISSFNFFLDKQKNNIYESFDSSFSITEESQLEWNKYLNDSFDLTSTIIFSNLSLNFSFHYLSIKLK